LIRRLELPVNFRSFTKDWTVKHLRPLENIYRFISHFLVGLKDLQILLEKGYALAYMSNRTLRKLQREEDSHGQGDNTALERSFGFSVSATHTLSGGLLQLRSVSFVGLIRILKTGK
jgi:hypothetical protein